MTGQDCILMMRNVEHLLDFFRIAVLKLRTGGHNWLFQRHKVEALTRVMSHEWIKQLLPFADNSNKTFIFQPFASVCNMDTH